MFKRILKFLSGGALPFYLLPLLMFYIIIGTVAQRYIGLYQAQNIFFNAPILWLGFLPLLGTPIILGFISLGLFIKFAFYSRWQWPRLGVHLAHLGVLLLLGGSFFMALSHQEGYMQLAKNETNNLVQDYHQRVFRINEQTINFEDIYTESFANLPFNLRIIKTCIDCQITKRQTPLKKGHGMAKAVDINNPNSLFNSKNDEEKIYGAVIEISNLSKAQNGVYIVFDVLPQALTFKHASKFYDISLGRATRTLPFNMTLNKFEKQTYSGTNKARDYVSDITITNGTEKFTARISMNQPLRYKNYTVYQSSMVQDSTGQTNTVLSTTYNAYGFWPYVATSIMAAGLLLHSIIMLIKRGQK